MYKNKIIFLLLMVVGLATSAYSQQNPENQKIQEATGKVVKVDVQGGILDVNAFQGEMAFSVPKDAIITRETHSVTLSDVKQGDPVSVRYYTSSEAVYVAMSVIDSQPMDN